MPAPFIPVPISLPSNVNKVVDVRAFGCGYGSDDTASLVKANNQARSAGIPIYFPSGTYLVSGWAGINQPIIGASRHTTKIMATPSTITHLLKLSSNVEGWSINNITLDGQSVGGHSLSIDLAKNVDIFNCSIINSGLCGIYITNSINVRIEDNYIFNSGSASGAASAGSGAGVSLYVQNGMVRNNTIITSGAANITGGSYAPSGSVDGYVDIYDNYCYDAGSIITQDNITLYDSTNKRIRVRNNRCNKSANHNIHVGGSDTEIVGNHCYNAAQSNILCSSRIAGTSTLSPFVGAVIENNTCDTAGLNNIQLDGVSQCTVIGNKCRGSAGNGILSLLSAANVEIAQNTIVSPAVAGISVGGISDGIIAQNSITSPGSNCIQLQQSGDATPVALSNTVVVGNVGRGGTYLILSTDGGITYICGNIGTGQVSTTGAITAPNAAVVAGNFAGATGQSFVFGGAVNSTGAFGTATGLQAITKGRYGFHALASGLIAAQGDAQGGRAVLRGNTGAGTTTSLTSDGLARNTHNIVNALNNSTINIAGNVILRDASGNSASFFVDATLKNNSGTASLVGTPVVTTRAADSAASSWTVTITADATNIGFNIVVAAVAGVYGDAHLSVVELAK